MWNWFALPLQQRGLKTEVADVIQVRPLLCSPPDASLRWETLCDRHPSVTPWAGLLKQRQLTQPELERCPKAWTDNDVPDACALK